KWLDSAPENPNKLYALVFDNTWMTNFVCDEHGVFEFKFDILADYNGSGPAENAELAETLLSTPQVIINPQVPEDPIFMNRLHKP
ncbi:MAG: hypothetical protein ACRC2T_00815, partial [Thermoguttaceae bacterium]